MLRKFLTGYKIPTKKRGAENAGVENAVVDKVWKAVRMKYSAD